MKYSHQTAVEGCGGECKSLFFCTLPILRRKAPRPRQRHRYLLTSFCVHSKNSTTLEQIQSALTSTLCQQSTTEHPINFACRDSYRILIRYTPELAIFLHKTCLRTWWCMVMTLRHLHRTQTMKLKGCRLPLYL